MQTTALVNEAYVRLIDWKNVRWQDRALEVSPDFGSDLVALDDALTALAAFDPRKSQIVELRFFGGLSVEETVEGLKLAPTTVMREWIKAKAWLYNAVTNDERPVTSEDERFGQ